MTEAIVYRCSLYTIPESFAKFKNGPVPTLLNKLASLPEKAESVFSCELGVIFGKSFFVEHFCVTTEEYSEPGRTCKIEGLWK